MDFDFQTFVEIIFKVPWENVCVYIYFMPQTAICSVHGDIFYSYTSYVRLIGQDLPCFYRT